MIQGENIICISNTSWFGNYAKSTVQILERLAKQNNVLFVEYHYTYKDIIATLQNKQNAPVCRMLGLKKRLLTIETETGSTIKNLVVPPGLPVYFLKNQKIFNLFFGFNVFIYRSKLKKIIKKNGFDNPIVITAYNPFYGLSLLGKLKEKAHVYYCYDGVESGFFGTRIYDYEKEFSQKANAVITTSEFLNAEKITLNAHCHVVKNGVDFPLFKKFAKTFVFNHKRKKVAFIGSLDHRFDIETVEYVVKELDTLDFEFTGDMRNEVLKNRLQKYPNAHFFNPIKPNDVPQLLAKYDVGIIPYIVNEVNKNIYPLKINEFLAVGVPVVMTAFANLNEFKELVSVAKNKTEFRDKLLMEIKGDSESKILKRIEFASQNSWDARTETFSDALKLYI